MGRSRRDRTEREYRDSESRRRNAFRRERQSEERRFELLVFVALVIVMMVMAMSNTNGRTMSFVGGGIMLGSGIIQLQRRFDTNIFTWLGAAALFALGYFMNPVPQLYPLLIMGGVLLASFVRGDL
jgi:hypothetical protein